MVAEVSFSHCSVFAAPVASGNEETDTNVQVHMYHTP